MGEEIESGDLADDGDGGGDLEDAVDDIGEEVSALEGGGALDGQGDRDGGEGFGGDGTSRDGGEADLHAVVVKAGDAAVLDDECRAVGVVDGDLKV